jgi:chromosome segregation ATPase
MTEARNEAKAEYARISDSLAALQKAKDLVEGEKAKAVEQAEVAKTEAAGLLSLNSQHQTQIEDLKAQLSEFKKVIDSLSSEKKQASRSSSSKKAQTKPKPEEK